VIRAVADLGNSRLKWGLVDETGRLVERIALPLDRPDDWAAAWKNWHIRGRNPTSWTISSVNPPVAKQFQSFLDGLSGVSATWLRSAADVAVRHELDGPETAGADRALAVAAAVGLAPPGRPGLVVACGTAVTVERVSAAGIWQGGAIAPGLTLSARALHLQTAQLPLVAPTEPPPAWGASTRPALEAGVFWGAVGAVRELISRQTAQWNADHWIIWTGGDSAVLAGSIAGDKAWIEPHLVLLGLARMASARH
jgi:type III pantothenate kinase